MLLGPSQTLRARLGTQLVLEMLLAVAGPGGFSGRLAGGSKERSSLLVLQHQEVPGGECCFSGSGILQAGSSFGAFAQGQRTHLSKAPK